MRPALRMLLRDPALLAVPVLAWTLLAPFLFGFDEPDALGFRFPLAFAGIPLALLAPGLRPAAAFVAVGGALLAIAPFAFGYADAGAAAWLSDPLSGAAILAAGALSASSRKSGAGAPPAGARRGRS